MKTKQARSSQLVSISIRVPRETAERLKAIADSQYRPVAAEVRRLIERRIAEEDS